MKLIVLLFALTFCTLTTTVVYAQYAKEYAIAYEANNSRGNTDILRNHVHVYVKVDTMQYQQQGGIIFSLRYNNTSADSISIVNPLDFIYMSLFNSKWAEMMPYVRSRVGLCKVNVASIPVFAYYREKYLIESVMLNSKPAPYDMDANNILLPGKSNLEITFKIPEVLDWKSAKPNERPPRIITPADKYKLTFTLSLRTDKDVSSFAYYKKDTIAVNYLATPNNSQLSGK